MTDINQPTTVSRGGMKMNKQKLAILEKAFSAEISGFPMQSKSKLCQELEESGHLQKASIITGRGERFPVTVSGYALTHRGRIEYCETCRDADEP